MTAAVNPTKKRAKQKPLTNPEGGTLLNLDKDGNPITEGVVTPKVRRAAEVYSAETYNHGKAKEQWENAQLKLNEAMHEAGITECIAKDHEGISYRYTIQTKETIKRKRLPTQVDDE